MRFLNLAIAKELRPFDSAADEFVLFARFEIKALQELQGANVFVEQLQALVKDGVYVCQGKPPGSVPEMPGYASPASV